MRLIKQCRNYLGEKIHASWVVMAWAMGAVSGVILLSIIRTHWFESGLWLIVSIGLIGFSLNRTKRWKLFLAVMAGGLMIFCRGSVELKNVEMIEKLLEQEVTIVGEVLEDPDTDAKQTKLRLKLLEVRCREGPELRLENGGVIYVSMKPEKKLQRADQIKVSGKLTPGFGTFAGKINEARLVKLRRPNPSDIFLMARNEFARKIEKYISQPGLALGLGYLLGMRSSLPEGLSEVLRTVGLTHIIVASGANLSILTNFARKLLGKISRFAGGFGAVILVVSYVGMVGVTPSMARAGLVAILSILTWYVGRKFRPERLLLLVAAITLVYNPNYLLDLGWLLSFGSFSGIMLVGPKLTAFFYGEEKPRLLGSTLIETTAAMITCLPILIYFFGTVSTIVLIANLLILPTITVVMAIIFVTGIGAMLAELWWGLAVWPKLTGGVADLLLNYHLAVINFFGAQKYFLVEFGKGQWWIFLSYLPIVLLIWRKKSLVAIEDNIKISGENANGNDGATNRVNKFENIMRKLIKGKNSGEYASTERSK